MSDRLLLNLQEAADLLGLSRRKVYELTRPRTSKPIPHVRLGRAIMFRRCDLVQYVEANVIGGQQ